MGIGNVRYTTSGKCDDKSLLKGTQPIMGSIDDLKVALSFNGNIVNTLELREEVKTFFPEFNYTCDSDIVCYKLLLELYKGKSLSSAIKSCMINLDGAFSVIGITGNNDFFAFKDQHGIKPLCAGHNSDESIYSFSSETVSFDINGFTRAFELEPGELVTVTKNGFNREQLIDNPKKAFCAFEYAYFARPDSIFNNKFVYEIREQFGRNLVKEFPEIATDADLILSVPETADDPAMGVHEESKIKWERASRRHRYVTDRAFILLDKERSSTIDRKINILGSKMSGKKIILTEDSIVRGDTTKVIISKLRKYGVKKIYMYVTFPRIIGPCFYGIDMATYAQLIGSTHSPLEIAKIIGADAVCYQSIAGLVSATGHDHKDLCLACITGEYPTPKAQKLADYMKYKFLSGYEEKNRIYEIEDNGL